jgi:two-component system, chemotaxis family, sensor kinase CheA
MIQAQAMTQLSALADKLAMELVFAEAGSDNGLLPIYSFINEMAEIPDLPGAAVEALVNGRALVDEILSQTGNFTAESIKSLNAWATDLQTAILSVKSGIAIPATPTKINERGEGASDCGLHLNLAGDRELLQEFVTESREHLQNIENGVLVLEDSPGDTETLNSIFRAFHTFKGGSGFLNLAPVNKLAHELEGLLDRARRNEIAITAPVIEVILSGGDTLRQFIDSIAIQLSGEAPQGPILIPTDHLRERISKILSAEKVAVPMPVLTSVETDILQRASGQNSGASSIKVEIQKLDNLVDMVGELVIAQSLVAQDPELRNVSNTQLAHNLAQLNRVTKELQRSAMSLRMIPVRATFRKMIRLVRDLSVRSGKQIELVLLGEETELDRNIVEVLADPLIHMMRNSVDHGIETPQSRAAAGKKPTGTILLSASHQGGNFVVQIKDDGAGLDRERILKKAVEQGLAPADETLTDQQVYALIFAPGFSTAETITDISGRGVGMDVVRQNIEKLRGRIEIESTPGQGTTFTIHLPLTLAIIDGLIVRIGEDRYIIPTLSVRESFRPTPDMLFKIHNRGELVDFRGRQLPLLRLKQSFTEGPDTSDASESVVIVVEADRAERCILVDELVGRQEVVIKNLGETFQSNPWLAGAAILGDGRVGLILDVNTLVNPRPQLAKAA